MALTLPPGMKLTWLGHSAFRVDTPGGKRILIDPWIQNNPACPPDKKDVGPIDLMLVTHGHYDHIEDAIPIAKKTNCKVVAIFEIVNYLKRKGVAEENLLPMNKGGTVEIEGMGLSVTMVHADHSCGITDGDETIYGGEAVGYVVTLSESGFAFYHSGDTAVFSDMSLISELYAPRLAMLPVGDRFVMSPREAAKAAAFLPSVEAIIPMHFGTFPLLTGTPAALIEELQKIGGGAASVPVIEFAPGETKSDLSAT